MSTALQPSIFGPIVTGADVEGWVLDLLKRWISTYLSEVERQHGLQAGHYPRPRGWAVGPSFDKWPEDQVPGILVSCPGTAAPPPKRNGDGGYDVRWTVEPGAVCSARTQDESHQLAMVYGAAIHTLLLQRPSLDGYANGVVWLGDSYSDLGYDDSRSLYTCRSLFTVEVSSVAYANAGPTTPDAPLTPDTDPWPDWPIVETAEVEVDRLPD